MQPEYFPWVLTTAGVELMLAKFLYDVIVGSRGFPGCEREGRCGASEVSTAARSHIDQWLGEEAASFIDTAGKSKRQQILRSSSRISPTGICMNLTYGVIVDTRHPVCVAAVCLALVSLVLVFSDSVRLMTAAGTPLISFVAIALNLLTAIYYLGLVIYLGLYSEPGVLRRLLDVDK